MVKYTVHPDAKYCSEKLNSFVGCEKLIKKSAAMRTLLLYYVGLLAEVAIANNTK
jgi:hypothetical protein